MYSDSNNKCVSNGAIIEHSGLAGCVGERETEFL